jgi:hypothetical protein
VTEGKPQVELPGFCKRHQGIIVRAGRFRETDPWRSLLIVSEMALFQGLSAESEVQERIDGDITRIGELGCLACYDAKKLSELLRVIREGRRWPKGRTLADVKQLGLRWIEESQD